MRERAVVLTCPCIYILQKRPMILRSPLIVATVYRVVPGSRNWQVETALEFWPVSCTIFRKLLAGIWGSFLRFIETGFRNWLAAFLGFFYDFPMMSVIFL